MTLTERADLAHTLDHLLSQHRISRVLAALALAAFRQRKTHPPPLGEALPHHLLRDIGLHEPREMD